MEKEQILSTIKEKVGQTSLSDRTLSDYFDENLPAEGTEPDDAYWERHTKVLKSLEGNYSHDVATRVEDFKKNYKPSAQQKGDGETDKRYSALEEKFDKLLNNYTELTEKLAKKESQQSQEQLMAQVKDAMKKQGATDDYVLRQTLRGVTFDTKKSVADLTKEMLAAYDSEYSDCRGKGAAPRNGRTGGSSAEKPFGNYFANKKARENRGKNSN